MCIRDSDSPSARNGSGGSPDPGHAAQAAGLAREAQVDLAANPQVTAGEPDRASGAVRVGELNHPSEEICGNCGHTEIRELFAATDRLYGTTDRVFQVVE